MRELAINPLMLTDDRPFDISDRRLVLQYLALTMHERAIKEIDAGHLRKLLAQQLADFATDPRTGRSHQDRAGTYA